MGCRSWQTSRGTLLRNDRPRRVRAPQRCPDRIHISRLGELFRYRYFVDTNKNTNTRIRIGSITRREVRCVPLSCRQKQKHLEIWR
ncbi:hypothetical protein X962_5632 [Burkholderia pseudomallei MSHR7343]|nr:hypothetical protein X962_5632 [Burkholderia pseudomallei MSHR7343]